jgi:type IV pilus assembly protein PilV
MQPTHTQRGATLIEVLVTVLLLAFGLLGIAAFQSKAQIGTFESYQRAQAVVLLEDIHARMSANGANAAAYAGATVYGVDDKPENCAVKATAAERDTCEWSLALQGASEASDDAKVGAMIGARGCIEEVQTLNATTGVCTPGIYRVVVAWQGNHETKAPAFACGKDKYGSEKLRRAISARVVVGTPGCKLT